MPALTIIDKKRALTVLDASRLRELVEDLNIDVSDRRSRELLISALADGRRSEFSVVLTKLSRDELKAMCRQLGFPDDGKEKASLVDRILGSVASIDSLQSDEATSLRATRSRASQLLGLLKRDELQEIVERCEIPVVDRRVVAQLVSGIVESDVSRAEVFESLPRVRLKELCRALGLDDSGREKSPLIARLAAELTVDAIGDHVDTQDGDDEADPDYVGQRASEAGGALGLSLLPELLSETCKFEDVDNFWPARVSMGGDGYPGLDIYSRVIGGTGRNPLERRFQNPGVSRSIRATEGRLCLLLGLWLEQGVKRAVLVAFDAYRRLDRGTRFSLFMPLALLEEAADTGFVSHTTTSGETLYAFRPDSFARYIDVPKHVDGSPAEASEGPWSQRGSNTSRPPTQVPLGEKQLSVEIRPKAGMFAAFARLNYKPWFALAELVDNAVQSYLTNIGRLRAEGETGPLTVDIHINDDEISVTDRAAGISLSDFPRAFSPATPPADASGLSEFGLGMKAAASWFAREWSVRTSPFGERVERTISFDVPKITREGLDHLPIESRATRTADHFTVVSMRNLRVRPKGSTLAKIKEHLASIYRLLIADGTLRLRVTSGGKSEELVHYQPKLLNAPFCGTPNGPSRLWRRDIDITLGDRRVRGWAGVMDTGKHSRAGFSVFRRRRLIEGSIGEAYRPRAVFGAHNSFASQRLVGELYVEGFDVTHTKDGIQWGDYEEDVAYELRLILDDVDFPILAQANGYRARKGASQLPPDFGEKAIDSASEALSSELLAREVSRLGLLSVTDTDAWSTPPKSQGDTLQERYFRMEVQGNRAWNVRLALVRDKASDWLDVRSLDKDGEEILNITINLDHEFSVEHLNNNERALEPIIRLAVAFSIAERQARLQGAKSAGTVRGNANELLRTGLSSAPLDASSKEDT